MNARHIQQRIYNALIRAKGPVAVFYHNSIGGNYSNPTVSQVAYNTHYVVEEDRADKAPTQEMPISLRVWIPAANIPRPGTNDTITFGGQEYTINRVDVYEVQQIDLAYKLYVVGTVQS